MRASGLPVDSWRVTYPLEKSQRLESTAQLRPLRAGRGGCRQAIVAAVGSGQSHGRLETSATGRAHYDSHHLAGQMLEPARLDEIACVKRTDDFVKKRRREVVGGADGSAHPKNQGAEK